MGEIYLQGALGLSLFVHLLLFSCGAFLLREQAAKQIHRALTWIELDSRPRPKSTDPKQEEEKKRRIVQTDLLQKIDYSVMDAFLGKQNQIVKDQTVNQAKKSSLASPSKVANSNPSEKKEVVQKRSDFSKLKDLSKLGVVLLPKNQPNVERKDQPQWATSGEPAQDYVKGVKESDHTELSTREFVFYGYFQRIREQLDRAWVPILKQKVGNYLRSGRHLASDSDLTTKLLVILNEGGEIVHVKMVSESGVQDLDEAAIRAFNQAGPFPNPPKGIIDLNREIRIPWHFILKT